jgi:hypothetical protein
VRGLRDYAWAAVAVLVIAGFLAGLVSTLVKVATEQTLTTVAWLPVGLACAWWLALQAWRRTVWGSSDSNTRSLD